MISHDRQPDESTNPTARDRSIVLIGMMGAGKSSIGKKLAQRLGMSFVDADEEIEKAAGMQISEIFEKFGEPYFRDGERRVIARLIAGKPLVLATGGGAFVNEETRAVIREQALSVWLDADLDVLVERVSRRSHRPLLVGKNPRDVLIELGKVRNPIYAEADFRVRTDASPHNRAVDLILKAISQ